MRSQRGARIRRLAALATRQHGVVALWQLIALGLSRRTVTEWVASGRLHPVHRDVYALGHAAIALNGRLMAAVLACGPGAVVSHRTAAGLWGVLQDARSVIDVLAAANRRSRKGIAFHRVRRLHPDDRTEVDGIPVTSLARTLLDVAQVVPRRKLVYALEQAERLRILDLREINACMARSHGHRGIKRLRRAIEEIEPEAQHAHEGMERLFIAFCRRQELQMPVMNVVVEGLTVDALWAQQKLIVELDSWSHHRSKRAFEEDRRRDAPLKRAGYEVLRVTYSWLTEEPDDLAETIRRLSESRLLAATA
jgi:very-short-patch-repair endonuclease